MFVILQDTYNIYALKYKNDDNLASFCHGLRTEDEISIGSS